jgi:type I restriction enzyme R subunit
MKSDKTSQQIKLDERNHVEKPLLDQLAGLGWDVLDLEMKQQPGETFRDSFTEVALLPVLRQQLQVINPWLQPDQVEEVVKQLTANFPSSSLLENNRHVFTLLQENTSISENRQTGEKSPTVTTVLSPSVSSKCGFSAPKTISSRTSFCSSTVCPWW